LGADGVNEPERNMDRRDTGVVAQPNVVSGKVEVIGPYDGDCIKSKSLLVLFFRKELLP
jgi:hypothetical protein